MASTHSEDSNAQEDASGPVIPEPSLALDAGAASGGEGHYTVLFRKYRPNSLRQLVGQDAMVRILSNAFESGRIAHGFILTGVRGVGKTTTARVIAKGLNCMGPDGQDRNDGEPTVDPCGKCPNCVAISESRHVDVLEMDAASRTGIDDIREIIEGVRYAPVQARYKVYIIDEVHMLSKAAFNGLLKTLEEPPPHVKFIFATTEIRKVPVTILSRCQRFDLRRIPSDVLIAYLKEISKLEGAEGEDGAYALITRAAEGSARDALSLLDQAISQAALDNSTITEERVRSMLGLADRGRTLDLFESLMEGDIKQSLEILREQYDVGADPLVVIQDLLDLTHWVTRLAIADTAAKDPTMSEANVERGQKFAMRLPVNMLSRTWTLLLKGLYEVRDAPQPIQAAEMVLIRLAYLADLPTPDEALRMLKQKEGDAAPASAQPSAPSAPGPAPSAPISQQAPASFPPQDAPPSQPQAAVSQPEPVNYTNKSQPTSLEEVVQLCGSRREIALKTQLEDYAHLVKFEIGKIELRLSDECPNNIAGRLSECLTQWTGQRWMVSLSMDEGAPTLSEQYAAADRQRKEDVSRDPAVAAVLKQFPGSQIVAIRSLEDPATCNAETEALDPNNELGDFEDL